MHQLYLNKSVKKEQCLLVKKERTRWEKDEITLVKIKSKDLKVSGTSEFFRNTDSSLTAKKANENTDCIHKIGASILRKIYLRISLYLPTQPK